VEAKCEHEWERHEDGDFCKKCQVFWIEWTRGFDSNVRPMHKKPEPLVRPNG